ncbi:MAG: VOC family protein [Phreatobacter sp.]|uniref:VOC family protein n=1 Tax=Phreatobacter sp. TaxID=1966341 RepID=UPI001A5A168E|nr:VOC family protein [Phreatobacter sp.]MBL8571899.1 VOC family protein [Phreatobacter sp.]
MTEALTPAAIALITLGVADLARATAFYEALGFIRSASQSNEQVTFLKAGGVVLALFGRAELAHDANLSDAPRGPFGGITIARNLPSKAAVDTAFRQALAAGAAPLKPPQDVFWGGYSGYVADPDGHPLELAWNPFFPLRDDGGIDLPG